MKKLTFGMLDELAKTFDVISDLEMCALVGGGNGTHENPFTEYEANLLIDSGRFNGGFVIDDNGECSYWLSAVTIWSEEHRDSYGGYGDSYGGYGDSYSEYGNNYGGYGNNNSWNPYNHNQNDHSWDLESFGNGNYNQYFFNQWNGGSDNNGNNNTPNFPLGESYGGVGDLGKWLTENKARLGSNKKLYYCTYNGHVFCGNQYVTTTSLNDLGIALKRVGYAGLAISVFDIVAVTENEGIVAGGKKLMEQLAGYGAAMAGAKAGAIVGSAICPGVGTALGVLVGSIIGSMGGSYVVEITLNDN